MNTRCIYYRLRPSASDPDNLALCPVLDFANHTTSNIHILPSCNLSSNNGMPYRRNGGDFTLLSPPGSQIAPDEELYLKYGSHTNTTLFTEYGFVNEIPQEMASWEHFQGEVDVQTLIEPLFERRGKVGQWMREILEAEGYWG